jgi:hypothetical protein
VAAALAAGCAAVGLAGPSAVPKVFAHSCWTRPTPGLSPLTGAPSVFPTAVPAPVPPAALARRVLDRLGDTRFVKGITLAAPPPITFQHSGHWGRTRPPKDALWAYISVPQAREPAREAEAESLSTWMLAKWEAELVRGALRDEFCAAGGAPLVGSTVNGSREISKETNPLLQRFPNPPERVLRERIADAGQRYGFRIVELRLLRPRQVAPLLVVETERDRENFAGDVAELVQSLHPDAYEGFFFAARDGAGPFVAVERVRRGHVEGGQWVASGTCMPYETLGGPIAPRSC